MPRSRPSRQVRIFARDYTFEAAPDAGLWLDGIARELDRKMHDWQARQPAATSEQLAVLAALEMLLKNREIAGELAALEHKLERLEALMMSPASGEP